MFELPSMSGELLVLKVELENLLLAERYLPRGYDVIAVNTRLRCSYSDANPLLGAVGNCQEDTVLKLRVMIPLADVMLKPIITVREYDITDELDVKDDADDSGFDDDEDEDDIFHISL